jgi:endonuclease G
MMHKISYLFIFIFLFAISCKQSQVVTPTDANVEIVSEDFESTSKTSYGVGNINGSLGSWTLDEALIGTTENDRKKGSRAVRIRETGILTSNFSLNIQRVTIEHAVYGTDDLATWELWTSADNGRNWRKQGQTVQSNANLQVATFNINPATVIQIEIRKVSGNRLNIDNITFEKIKTSIINTNVGKDDHLTLGNPSNATTSLTNFENYLMSKPQYVLSYNRTRGTANWVSWHLNKDWKGNAARQDDFRADPALPPSWNAVSPNDYTNTGFDRGHICPSDDRDASIEDNSATFLMTNMLPQAPQNNRQVWRLLEEYGRTLVTQGNELYIIAGGYGRGGSGSRGGMTETIADGKVVVPNRVWKVILVIPNGGDDLNRINATTRVIAVDMPNTEASADKKWYEFRVSVRDIEAKTGLNFFDKLPVSVQNAIESKTDNAKID